MEWRFDAAEPHSLVSMRREILAYLGRHASPTSDLDAAALVVSELLANVCCTRRVWRGWRFDGPATGHCSGA
jgi:hypothetical protein